MSATLTNRGVNPRVVHDYRNRAVTVPAATRLGGPGKREDVKLNAHTFALIQRLSAKGDSLSVSGTPYDPEHPPAEPLVVEPLVVEEAGGDEADVEITESVVVNDVPPNVRAQQILIVAEDMNAGELKLRAAELLGENTANMTKRQVLDALRELANKEI